MRSIIASVSLIIGLLACTSNGSKNSLNLNTDLTLIFPNTLSLKKLPANKKDRSAYSFSDLGAWHSYALNPKSSGGFVGPYLMTDDNGIWASPNLVELEVSIEGKKLDLKSANNHESTFLPGRLVQSFEIENLLIRQELIFISNRSTLVNYHIECKNSNAQFAINFKGNTWLEEWSFSRKNEKILLSSQNSLTQLYLDFDQINQFQLSNQKFTTESVDYVLENGESTEISYVQSAYFSEKERLFDHSLIASSLKKPEKSIESNNIRWNEYITKTLQSTNGTAVDSAHHFVAIKALNTLVTNWRSAAGELKHDGLFPSYAYGGFHGFWAWDSWKHAVGLADIIPQLAKDQILSMYDYQDIDGMIADCIFRDTLIENHNWRDTKPPLSAWAISKVFDATKDTAFVQAIYPKLNKYHQWWYNFRDHDQNGLCEYGSTDGTRVAAAWESGMDNAVRFDEAIMRTNEEGGYSLDQESVDLNSYLYAEKRHMVNLSIMLGREDEALRLGKEADSLGIQIRNKFYSPEVGYFFDVMLDNKMIDVFGPEGWIPLWANVATDEQAKSVLVQMMDESRFNTKVPLLTLDASHVKFDPKDGYWRGPVWLDQIYFGIKGMENYGYKKEADSMKTKLFQNAEGLLTDEPIRENYHPITGEGLNANHFSWSAAHILMLIRE